MPEYAYIARTTSGEKISGKISAPGKREALAQLSAKDIFPLEVKDADNFVEGRRVGRVPAQLVATAYGQLSSLLSGGVPLLRSLEVLQKQTSHAGLHHVLEEVRRYVEEGTTLADALRHFPEIFSEMAVSMIRAGGEGGFLEESLSRVADFTEAQEDLKKRTLGAVAYPAFIACVGVVVIVILIVFFVPMFQDLFERLRSRGQLPAVTDWLLWTSDVLRKYGLFVAAGVVGIFYLVRRWLKTEQGKLLRDRLALKIPLMGPILLNLAVARFCRILGSLLRNGVPILRSLEISRNATGNILLADSIAKASENISAGQSLAEPLSTSGYFPPSVVEMIAVAEQANNLETVLIHIADGLDRRTWRRLDLAVRLIEPLLLLLLASAVLMVVVALLVPVLKMSQTI